VGRRNGKRIALEQEVYIALLRTAGDLERGAVELLKAFDMSPAQYNVLRILRGAGPDGATCGNVSGRLLRHDPDVTRLLDRLEKRGLVSRSRDALDRRVVRTRITEAGLKLLAELAEPVEELHRRQLGHLSEASLAALRDLADSARGQG